jgi:hypothetical protein
MCKKTKGLHNRIDPCIKNLILTITPALKNQIGAKIVACCCGHGKYPLTIITEYQGSIWDIVSRTKIPRKRKFYKKDKRGYYFIPETIK